MFNFPSVLNCLFSLNVYDYVHEISLSNFSLIKSLRSPLMAQFRAGGLSILNDSRKTQRVLALPQLKKGHKSKGS